MKSNIIREKSFEFAVNAIHIYKLLLKKNEYVLSKQFFRSATSIGANVEEALAGYSKRDFAAKIAISSKEARECLYWLRIIEVGKFVDYDLQPIKSEAFELINILTAIVKTTQKRIRET
ncbi:MAG: four helix bundle protein [Bacteroidia bacterium]|jgi:four helix bundle protein